MQLERPFSMGLETEYAVSCRSGHERCTPEKLAEWIAATARRECCCMADMECPTGVYLDNGARLYTDINGHPEYATPECFTPHQIVAHDKAGERLLQRLAERVARSRGLAVTVAKSNVGAVRPDTITWGNHESYLSWIPLTKTVDYLVPHLVTRLAYAGSGCLSSHADGFGFELSQRARHLRRVVGGETTHDRAIFCTRVRKSSDRSTVGWTRAHLIGKDSQRAPLGTYLTVGTTGLIFCMLNQGFAPSRLLTLAEPVRALRAVSVDPWYRKKLRLADGRTLTALEIQESYLEDCEAFAKRGPMPAWGADVLRHWRAVLSTLREDPRQLAGKLDAYTKLAMYEGALRRAGIDWPDLARGLALLARLRHELPEGVVERLLAGDDSSGVEVEHAAVTQARSLVDADGVGALDRLRFILRLQVVDLKYHELGGLFDDFCRMGQIDHVVLTEADVEQAVRSAPAGGRAARRAELIRSHHGERGWAANWQTVMQMSRREAYEMSNPFDAAAQAVPMS